MPRRKRPARRKARPRAPAPAPTPTAGPMPVAQLALRERALDALQRRSVGKKLSVADVNSIAKYEALREREAREAAYRRCSGEDLRAILGGISREQIQRLRSYGMPVNETNTYNLFLAVPSYIQHERARLKAAQAPALSALERNRLLDYERKRDKHALERGELLPRAQAEAEMERAAREISAELLGWATTLAPKLAGQDHRAVARILRDEVRRVLGRASQEPAPARGKERSA